MKEKARIIWMMIIAVMLMVSICSTGLAEPSPVTTVANGYWGEDVTWNLDSEGKLTVSGNGSLRSYYFPPYQYRDQITCIELEDDITTVGSSVFNSCGNVTEIILNSTVTDIGDYAFNRSTAIQDVTYHGTCSDANTVNIGEGNDQLFLATWHCNDGDCSRCAIISLKDNVRRGQ